MEELKGLMRNGRALIVDARPPDSYARGHIPGAVSLDAGKFDNLITDFKAAHPDKNLLLVVYCDNSFCAVADDLQQKLIDHGYAHVGIYRDGWDGWLRGESSSR